MTNGIHVALWLAAAASVFTLGLYAFNSLDQDGLGIALCVLVFPVCLIMAVSHIEPVSKRFDSFFGRGDE